jgi:uncharacterized protein (TIGR00661 family)
MATIFYGMSGEGRGHATRARTIVEALRGRHRVVLFAPDCAHALLAPIYAGTDVRVEPLPGLAFAYAANGRVDLLGTAARSARYRLELGRYVRGVLPVFDQEQPDLVVADFEPILPRAARATGIPFLSLDHQHYLVVNDLSELPWIVRQQAAVAAGAVRVLYDWQVETIVSSFFVAPLRPGVRASQIGVLIRPELQRARPHHGRHLLVYMRRHVGHELLDVLHASGDEVRLYGLGARPKQGRIEFRAFDERRFMDDLVDCRAVVCTAGNQLVGEALYLRKPVLGIPEPRNFEQAVNAHYLRASGGGWATRRLTLDVLDRFVERVDEFRSRIVPDSACGNAAAVGAIARHLPGRAAEAPIAARAGW